MEATLTAIRFAKDKQGNKLPIYDLSNNRSIARTVKQFNQDLERSLVTLSSADAAHSPELDLVRVNDLIGGAVSANAEWNNAGSTFEATDDYVQAILTKNPKATRKVEVNGKPVDKIPEVGDTIVRTTDGYHVDGYVSLHTNNGYNDRITTAKEISRGQLQAFGKPTSHVEAISAVEEAIEA